MADLEERLAQTISKMDYYRHGRESLDQVATSFVILAHSAYALRLWLAGQATNANPEGPSWWRRMFGG